MIPNHFHFVFGLKRQTEYFHLMHYLCIKSCLEVNRPERIYFYYHHEPYGPYWDLIKPFVHLERIELPEEVRKFRYTNAIVFRYRYAHAADLVRLDRLIERGGVYADMDTLFVHPVPRQLFDRSCVMGKENGLKNIHGQSIPTLCNAWIAAEKGAPFLLRWRENMMNSFDGSWSNHSTVLPWQLSEQMPQHIHVEPEASFYGLLWNPEDLKTLFEQKKVLPPTCYSLHLWSHLWWAESRRDFSRFSGIRLSYEYVKNADTTYASYARPYLPPHEPPVRWEHRLRKMKNAGWRVFSRLQHYSKSAEERFIRLKQLLTGG